MKLISAEDAAIVIKPEQIPFISYPYEWSFSQYKHAALHTLKLQKYCLQHGWSLKDAPAFNITFYKGAPVFIDSLSFDEYREGEPWRAYKQFILHFLGPLVLAKYHGSEMLKTLQLHIDGLPLQKIANLLPFSAKFSTVLYTNIFLAAKYDKKYSSDEGATDKKVTISKGAQLKIIDSLYNYIKDLELNEKTEWKDYYSVTNYDDSSFEYKKQLVEKWGSLINAKRIIDVGGNDGTFGRVLHDKAIDILVTDIDANAVDYNYKKVLKNKEHNILPLVSDLLNPSPGIGLNNRERSPLLSRIIDAKYDMAMALALIHHISLTGNVPFDMSAQLFASLTPYLIIEFPDRGDSWVDFLLKSKREFAGHFDSYNLAEFENVYMKYFDVVEKEAIPNTKRTMFLLKRK
jgi:ribosomal protein L11 methylase PrmA